MALRSAESRPNTALHAVTVGFPDIGRTITWAAPGRGKRGGHRVIYYVRRAHGVIWMLTMYPKNVADKIPAHILRQIRKEVEDG
jgi:hypothetical protein